MPDNYPKAEENTIVLLENAHTVTLSNALIRSGQSLSLIEKRLVMLAISKINPMKRPGECVTRVSANEYMTEYGVDAKNAYEQLKIAANHLFERKIVFFEPAHKRNGKPLEIKNKMRWVGKAKYHKGDGWVELHWWKDIVPHLVGLQAQFTTYKLQQAGALRSIYSWRMLELLMRFKSTGYAEYEINDFCTSMELNDKQKSDFAYIRRRVIEPAIRELNEKDDWIIKWDTEKQGRKVVKIKFTFKKNPQRSLEL